MESTDFDMKYTGKEEKRLVNDFNCMKHVNNKGI